MNPFSLLRIEVIERPIFNLLIVLLAFFGGNLGLAIVVLTIIIRLLLVKNAMAATKMQSDMTDFQPKMQEIQERYKDDPQRMSQEMMNLFKKSWWGPLKWCLTMLVQIPVFLGLFFTVKAIALGEASSTPYSFLTFLDVDIHAINSMFMGMNLLEPNNIILTVLASVLMYAQTKLTTMIKPAQAQLPGVAANGMPDMSKMMWFMNIFLVVMMGWFVRSMPGAIGVYIVTTTLFGVVQQGRQYRPVINAQIRAAFAKK